jgi:hypothetical protein
VTLSQLGYQGFNLYIPEVYLIDEFQGNEANDGSDGHQIQGDFRRQNCHP